MKSLCSNFSFVNATPRWVDHVSWPSCIFTATDKHHLESYMSRFQLASRLQASLHRSQPLFYSLELSSSLSSFLSFFLYFSLGFLASQGGLYIVFRLNDPATVRVFLKGFSSNKIWKCFCSVAVDRSCPAVDRPTVDGRPSHGRRSTGPSWAVHRFLTFCGALDTVSKGQPLSGLRSTVA